MGAKKREAMWFDGVAFADGLQFPDAISFSVIEEPLMITHVQGDSGAERSWQTGRKVTGVIGFNAISADLFAKITGGTKTTGTHKRVREGDEGPHTIAANIITLAQVGDSVEDTVELFGAGGTVFKKVSGAPAVGEFSYVSATGVCTLNAGETETTIYPQYVYVVAGSGSKVDITKFDIPCQMELWGTLRTKDLNASGVDCANLGDIIIHLAKIERTGNFEFGADKGGSTKSFSFEYTAIVEDPGDWETYFPA